MLGGHARHPQEIGLIGSRKKGLDLSGRRGFSDPGAAPGNQGQEEPQPKAFPGIHSPSP